jgi:DNA-binding transcriptional LysR family regulator
MHPSNSLMPNPMNLDTGLLRSFVLASEVGSLGKAAQRLHRVPSAVSQQIQRLEMQAGGPLFVRARSGLTLTERGRTLLPLALRLLAVNDEAISKLSRRSTQRRLAIGTSDAYAMSYLPAILRLCARDMPDVSIELHGGYSPDIWARYELGEIDVALAQSCPSSTLGDVVHVESLRWICASDSVPENISPVPLVLFTEGCRDREVAMDALTHAGMPFDVQFSSTSHAAVLAAVSAGMGVSASLLSTTTPGLKTLSRTAGFPKLGAVEIALAHADRRPEAAASRFARIARAYFTELRSSPAESRHRLLGFAA